MPEKSNLEAQEKMIAVMNDLTGWASTDGKTLTPGESSMVLAMTTEMLMALVVTIYSLNEAEANKMRNAVMTVIMDLLDGKKPLPGYI